jgi:hypothetical protein
MTRSHLLPRTNRLILASAAALALMMLAPVPRVAHATPAC